MTATDWPNTDKVALGYLPVYKRLAGEFGPAARVCEIGVYRGASLRLWQLLFPEGLVVGVDRDQGSRWPPGAIRVVSEQTAPDLPAKLAGLGLLGDARFDLIVEDAAHDGTKTRATFDLLWPLVAPGGVYVVEDWQIGFPAWDAALYPTQPSMVEAARGLLDLLDRQDGDVEEITYRYGLILARKKTDAH